MEIPEWVICNYIIDQYRQLGFDRIAPLLVRGDFILWRNGRKLTTEVEIRSHNFVAHGHDKERIDLLIVLNDNEVRRDLLPDEIMVLKKEDIIAWRRG